MIRVILAAISALAMLAASGCASVGKQVWIPAKDGDNQSSSEVDIKLEGTLYLPEGKGPFPVLIFNHGSTSPTFPDKQTVVFPEIARVFSQHGIATLVPMRRGRGASGGRINDFVTCDYPLSLAALRHGMQDIDAAVVFVRGQPDLDAKRIFFGGHSRGAALSTYYVGKHPEIEVKGVVNFAGGWMATWKCTDFGFRMFREAGARTKTPVLFIYGEKDSIIYKETARMNVESFTSDGGNGVLKIYPTPWGDGHAIANENARAWEKDVDEFLTGLGYPKNPGLRK